MAASFWGLELAPGQAYKLTVPEDVELQINQACLGPGSRVRGPARCRLTCCEDSGLLTACLLQRQDSRTTMLTVKQLDEDGDGESGEEMSVARLSIARVDCQKVKLLFRCASVPVQRTLAARSQTELRTGSLGVLVQDAWPRNLCDALTCVLLRLCTAVRRWSSSKLMAVMQCTSPARC